MRLGTTILRDLILTLIMPPKKLPHKTSKSSAREDEEQPDQEPDFTVEDVERRVETFLHDQRDTRRGGAGINPDTLLLRRTRAAIIAIHDRLRVYPDTSNRALARVWDMFRSMAVRSYDITCGTNF